MVPWLKICTNALQLVLHRVTQNQLMSVLANLEMSPAIMKSLTLNSYPRVGRDRL